MPAGCRLRNHHRARRFARCAYSSIETIDDDDFSINTDPRLVAESIATTIPSCRQLTIKEGQNILAIAAHLPPTLLSLELLLAGQPPSNELDKISHLTALTHLRLWHPAPHWSSSTNLRSLVLEVHHRGGPNVQLRPYMEALPNLQSLVLVQAGTTCLDDVEVGVAPRLTSLRLGRTLGLDDVHVLHNLRVLEAMLHVGGPRCSLHGLQRMTRLERLTADVGIEYV